MDLHVDQKLGCVKKCIFCFSVMETSNQPFVRNHSYLDMDGLQSLRFQTQFALRGSTIELCYITNGMEIENLASL